MAGSAEQFLLGREQFGMRFGLERMRRLLKLLDDPQDAFPAVHVVGTNGKSTTTLMIGAALRAQHISTGCFTSPHLRTFRERIDLGGEMIDEAAFATAADRVRAAVARLDAGAAADDKVTQFEAVTAIAFCAFVNHNVDVAIVEAGLGGRLDATNVLGDSRVQVLTGVGIDHVEYLGETIEEIAREKLAVVRSRAALVTGSLGHVAEIEANRIADEHDARLIETHSPDPLVAELPGGFVRDNATLALTAAETSHARIRPGHDFDRETAAREIRRFAESARLEGRLQVSNSDPTEIRDVAHNAQAAEALIAALPEVAADRPVTLVVAMLRDKNIDQTLGALLPAVGAGGTVVCTQTSNPRSLSAGELAETVERVATDAVTAEIVDQPDRAVARARGVAGRGGVVVVTGSNYLLSDLLRGPGAPAGATI